MTLVDEIAPNDNSPSESANRPRLSSIVLNASELNGGYDNRGLDTPSSPPTPSTTIEMELAEYPQMGHPVRRSSESPLSTLSAAFPAPIASTGTGAVALPIGDPDAPEKPGFLNYPLRYEQQSKTDDVRRRSLHETLSRLRENGPDQSLGSLVERIVIQLPADNKQATRLSKAYEGLQQALENLEQDYQNFLALRIKQKRSSCPSLCDARTLFFGNTLTALFLRSALHSAAIAITGSAIQYFTYLILDGIVRSNPEAIPADTIERISQLGDGAQKEIGLTTQQAEHLLAFAPKEDLAALANLSEKEIERVAERIASAAASANNRSFSKLTNEQLSQAQSEFAKPASSLLDEKSSSKTAIYACEIAHSFGTGSAVAVSSNLLERKFQSRELRNSLAFKRQPPTTLERMATTAKKSAISQAATGLTGFTIGSVANITGKSISGAPIGDIFKDAGAMALFQVLTSVSNASLDTLQAGLLPSDKYGECCSQIAKVSLRTLCSVASQYLKTEIYRRFNARSGLGVGDHVRVLMTGGLGGLTREMINTGTALLASHQAPADLRFSKNAAATINQFAEVLRALNDGALSEALAETPLESERVARFNSLTELVRPLREAEELKPYSYAIKQKWEDFDAYLDEIMRQRNGPGPHNV